MRALRLVVATLLVAACGERPVPVAPDAGPRDAGPRAPASAGPRLLLVSDRQAQVAVGAFVFCTLGTDGAIACRGRTGDAATDNHFGELNVPSGTFTQITAEVGSLCALRTDGTLACWGRNEYGQTTPPSGTFTQVSMGRYHACGRRTDGTLACWGVATTMILTPPAGTFAEVSSGQSHACARRTDGTVTCWGGNTFGELDAPSGSFVQVASGHIHACGVRSDGTIACWGVNNYTPPAFVPAGSFTQVDVGETYMCALRPDGTPVCWAPWGALTTLATRVLPTATLVAPATAFVNGSYTLALTDARVPGHPEATTFRYAFDCGAAYGGYGPATPAATGSCVPLELGPQTVRAKVIDQDGDFTEYTATVTVTLRPQTVAFTSTPPSPAVVGGRYAVTIDAPSPGTPPQIGTSPGTVCQWTGSEVVLTGAGTCRVTVLRPEGFLTYAQAFAEQSFAVVLKAQAAGFTSTPLDPGYVGAVYTATISAPPPGTSAVFAAGPGTVCVHTGGVYDVTLVGPGTCTLRLDRATSTEFAAAHAEQAFAVVARQAQAITFTSTPPSPAYVSDTYELSATGGGSGNPVTFADGSALDACMLDGNGHTVRFTRSGTCLIVASQAGNAAYFAAPLAMQQFSVDRRPQTVAFTSTPPNPARVGASYTVAATGGASGNPVTFGSLTPAVCTVSGSTVQLVDVGTCTVAADQAGNAAYDPAPRVTRSFAVSYAFEWLNAAFGNPASVNVIYAGTAYHVRFRLGANLGLDVFAAGAPTSRPVTCPTRVNIGGLVTLPPPVASALRWDAATASYDYTWQTDAAWKGTCRELVLTLRDGSTRSVVFQMS